MANVRFPQSRFFKLKYLLITDSFSPKINSGAVINGDLVSELLRVGNQVLVVTFQDDLKKSYDYEIQGKLEVIRISIKNREKSRFHRALAEMSYSFKIISVLKSFPIHEVERIIIYSPSIFFGKAASWLKKKIGSKVYLIVRDIFPRWALEAGLLRRGVIYYYFKYIERRLYKSADLFGIESKSDLQYFKKYINENKQSIEVLNNWSSPLDTSKISDSSPYIDDSYINIVYGGNISEAQDLFSLIKEIDRDILRDNQAKLTIMGAGQQKLMIEELLKEINDDSIQIMSPQDRYTYLSFISKADIGLISLSKNLKSHNYPLKMLGYIQLGKPVLASVNNGNEIIPFLHENDIGFASISGDWIKFNQNLKRILSDEQQRKSLSENAIKVFENEFAVESTVEKIDSAFEKN